MTEADSTRYEPIDDELISAFLDGEVDPSVAARIGADQRAQARAGELNAVHEALAAPLETLSDEAVDRLVATAVAALPSPVSDLNSARLRRFGRPAFLAAAAAVIGLVAVGVGLLRGSLGNDGFPSASSTLSTEMADRPDPADGAGYLDISGSDDGGDASEADFWFANEAGSTAEEVPDAGSAVLESDSVDAELAPESDHLSDAVTATQPAGEPQLPGLLVSQLGNFADEPALVNRVRELIETSEAVSSEHESLQYACGTAVRTHLQDIGLVVLDEASAQLGQPGAELTKADLAIGVGNNGELVLALAAAGECEVIGVRFGSTTSLDEALGR